jgi:hypothetical protein
MSKHDEKVQAIMKQLYALLSDESVPMAATRFSLTLIRDEVDDLLTSLCGAQ